jgi:hypothetical protein
MYKCNEPLIARILTPLYEWHSVENVLDRLADEEESSIHEDYIKMRIILEDIIEERIRLLALNKLNKKEY